MGIHAEPVVTVVVHDGGSPAAIYTQLVHGLVYAIYVDLGKK